MSGLHFRCVVCRDGELKPVSEGRDIGSGSWACVSHFLADRDDEPPFDDNHHRYHSPAVPMDGCANCIYQGWVEDTARIAAAADLVRQYRDRTGPKPGDPFDLDVWAGEAAELLAGGAL